MAVLAILQLATVMFPFANPAFSGSLPAYSQTTDHHAKANKQANADHGHCHDDDCSKPHGKKHYSDHSHDIPTFVGHWPATSGAQPKTWEAQELVVVDHDLRLKVKRPPRLNS